jgi:[glutamine synthetase] adenylyltransferase / [glutamine synthetase]-adenylyl-L-tyrosine phosphorylase
MDGQVRFVELKLLDAERASRNLDSILKQIPVEKRTVFQRYLFSIIPTLPDPDMGLNNLERFLTQSPGSVPFPMLIDSSTHALEFLLQLISTSQFLSDVLIRQPEWFTLIQQPLRGGMTVREMVADLDQQVLSASDDATILRRFRLFRQREQLRIGINDVIRERPLEEIIFDLSCVADASVEVALRTALRTLTNRFGVPFNEQGEPSRVAVFAFGKLGGLELNYSSDIDLMFIYDDEGQTQAKGRGVNLSEFYSRVVAEVVRLLSANTDRGQAYRVDLRLRPNGDQGPTARSIASTLNYYDQLGRTWERQALIKLRPIAGDMQLGNEFLKQIEPFVYRRYLSFGEINEIKAMKRRIEKKVQRSGISDREVKAGRGGIRDIEFTIQFLQLLNGGDAEMQQLRQRNTLDALQALERTGCLSHPEARALDDGYRFLRKTEHRLQMLFDLQTHKLPESNSELTKLALRMGYLPRAHVESEEVPSVSAIKSSPTDLGPQRLSPLDEPVQPPLDMRNLLTDPLERFLHDYQERTRLNRNILDHLLHSSFVDSDEQAEPESDLILSSEADEATIRSVLERYPFHDVMRAFRNLQQLAQEDVPFLSTRRCRQFLASIAPQLLRAVAETPDPDQALLNLERVSASLGAKAVLWELFSFNPPSLKLYVDICSNSSFLSQILINNPGMIDDLLDNLILNQPRTKEELQGELRELMRGATSLDSIETILHSFQDKEYLRIGVRDLLNKEDVRETTAALSDLAETILVEVIHRVEPLVSYRFGTPMLASGDRAGNASRYCILALGKLGGCEMSYQSDLDLILVYEGDGRTVPPATVDPATSVHLTDNSHYFTELAQRIIKSLGQMGPMGKLYPVDMRLRPTGKSGSLTVPMCEFLRYFERGGGGQIWERQSLTRARVIHGDATFAAEVIKTVQSIITGMPPSSQIIDEIRQMRQRLEQSTTTRSLKRTVGGMVDVEFLTQTFQILYGSNHPELLQSNTWKALENLHLAGFLSDSEVNILTESYRFLRFAESRLRIVTNRPLNEFPDQRDELEKFALRLNMAGRGRPAADTFLEEFRFRTQLTRKVFETVLDRERMKFKD